jgi:hypothetical protein
VVGIQIEGTGMYTGTLISDLMATVELVRHNGEQRRMTEELHQIYTMQIPVTDNEQILTGAA